LRTNRGGEAVEVFEARAKARPNVPHGFDLWERAQAQV